MAGFRALLGLSEAVAIPTGTKMSTIWFPSRERSIATGWFNSGSSIGAMITPPLVIWLASIYGWRPAFLITGTLGVLLGIVWYLALSGSRESSGPFARSERAYINAGRTPRRRRSPRSRAILSQPKFLGIIIARFLTEPAWQTFDFWIPLYMVSVRGHGHQAVRAVRLAAVPVLRSRLHFRRLSRADPAHRFKLHMVNARLTVITIGALCMVGPALISFVVDPITAILCFSLGGFAHQMLSSMMYALMGDVFEKPEVATATGIAGMFGYLGGALFTLMLGALASSIGYEPLFALLFLFDLVAAYALGLPRGAPGAGRRTASELRP